MVRSTRHREISAITRRDCSCHVFLTSLLLLPPQPYAQITCKEVAEVSAEAVLQKPPQWQDVSIRGRPVCQKVLHDVMDGIWAGERPVRGLKSHLMLCQENIKGIRIKMALKRAWGVKSSYDSCSSFCSDLFNPYLTFICNPLC